MSKVLKNFNLKLHTGKYFENKKLTAKDIVKLEKVEETVKIENGIPIKNEIEITKITNIVGNKTVKQDKMKK